MKIAFKTLKAPLLLAATFSALSINVVAETYTVQVELNSTIDDGCYPNTGDDLSGSGSESGDEGRFQVCSRFSS